jgi:uncharacterized membrane protein (UPF0127 family)
VNRGALLVLALATSIAACGGDDTPAEDTTFAPVLRLDTTRLRIARASDTIAVTVELARTAEEKQLGLMERRSLGENAGMLFLYDSTQASTSGFWMYRTRIPLDIAFIDSAGTIRSIQQMTPCASDIAGVCPTYPANAPYRFALEVNAGYFAKHGIGVGHRVVLADTSR